MSAPEAVGSMGFVRDCLATDLMPHALPPLSALTLGAQQARQVAPTGAPGDAPPLDAPPLDLQGMLSVEPGLIDLILAAGAANRAQDDPAIYATCSMVQAWLKTHKLGANRKDEKVLWKTLVEAVFPDAPVPPHSSFSNFSREQWPVDNWRFWFKEMCARTERYKKARKKHAKLADEAHNAQQRAIEASRAMQADAKRVLRQMDLGNDSALFDNKLAVRYRLARRRANELTASEETAQITMNEQRLFLTQWDPFPPTPVPVGAAPVP